MNTINHCRNGMLKLEAILETASVEHTSVVFGYYRVLRKMFNTAGATDLSVEKYKMAALEKVMLQKLDLERNFFGLLRKTK